MSTFVIPIARQHLMKNAKENRPRLTLLIKVCTDSLGPSARAFRLSASSRKLNSLRTISLRRMLHASLASGSSSLPVLLANLASPMAGSTPMNSHFRVETHEIYIHRIHDANRLPMTTCRAPTSPQDTLIDHQETAEVRMAEVFTRKQRPLARKAARLTGERSLKARRLRSNCLARPWADEAQNADSTRHWPVQMAIIGRLLGIGERPAAKTYRSCGARPQRNPGTTRATPLTSERDRENALRDISPNHSFPIVAMEDRIRTVAGASDDDTQDAFDAEDFT